MSPFSLPGLGLVGLGFDDKRVLNGILFMLITCCRLVDMPSRYGSTLLLGGGLGGGAMKVFGGVCSET